MNTLSPSLQRTSVWARGLAAVSLVAGAWALSTAASQAHARDVYWSVGVNSPGVSIGASNAPVVVHQPPAYYYAPPVVVQPAPVYYHRPPAVVYGPPVVYAPPRPVVIGGHWRDRPGRWDDRGHGHGHGHWHDRGRGHGRGHHKDRD